RVVAPQSVQAPVVGARSGQDGCGIASVVRGEALAVGVVDESVRIVVAAVRAVLDLRSRVAAVQRGLADVERARVAVIARRQSSHLAAGAARADFGAIAEVTVVT